MSELHYLNVEDGVKQGDCTCIQHSTGHWTVYDICAGNLKPPSLEERVANQWGFLYATVGAGFANLVIRLSNQQLDRPRPFVTLEDVEVLFYRPTDPSFPANAAAFGFAMAAGVWLVNRRLGMVVGVGAMLFAGARVYAGMHYPLDIVSGALLGIVTTWVFSKALHLISPVVLWSMRLLRAFFVA